MDRLNGKVAVITGGGGGIGRAAAALFVAEGANVVLVDIDERALAEVVSEIGSNQVSAFVADVTSAADNAAMVACAEERYGGLDIFLANAGIEGDVAPLIDYDEARFDQVMNVNVKGVFLGLQSAIPALHKRGGGSIVITSSIAGVRGAPGIAAYATSKHAVIGLMRSAAKECAAMNIRVNTVNPSPVETPMMRRIEQGISEDVEQVKLNVAQDIPMNRYAEPEDIARVMLFLASDESSWVTGSVNMADGGQTA
ncbi:MAG: SDR family oxidoreductase [Gammaproteobacteria bacterium]|jgi:NAD(P)-dependent dehydrogenase (short-subunit alcohol dehydrogenase family)|nr:SDR family oxidoreductase [Gammaproteobacteria bacterium]